MNNNYCDWSLHNRFPEVFQLYLFFSAHKQLHCSSDKVILYLSVLAVLWLFSFLGELQSVIMHPFEI